MGNTTTSFSYNDIKMCIDYDPDIGHFVHKYIDVFYPSNYGIFTDKITRFSNTEKQYTLGTVIGALGKPDNIFYMYTLENNDAKVVEKILKVIDTQKHHICLFCNFFYLQDSLTKRKNLASFQH